MLRPVKQAGFHQRRGNRQIRAGFFEALGHGSHAVAYLEADVPQGRDEGRQVVLGAGRQLVGQQQHDVDIGVGMQFATAVAAYGDQRRAAVIDLLPPKVDQYLVDDADAFVHQLDDRLARLETSLQVRAESSQLRTNFPVRLRLFSDRLRQVSVPRSRFGLSGPYAPTVPTGCGPSSPRSSHRAAI